MKSSTSAARRGKMQGASRAQEHGRTAGLCTRADVSQDPKKRADARAADLAPIIARVQASGVTSLYGIAKALTALAVATPAGTKKMAGITGPAGVGTAFVP
jgi:hypothetical protein